MQDLAVLVLEMSSELEETKGGRDGGINGVNVLVPARSCAAGMGVCLVNARISWVECAANCNNSFGSVEEDGDEEGEEGEVVWEKMKSS
jgi:hypothetical protein